MDLSDFGARGSQNAFSRHAVFSWFSYRFGRISIWFPWISMDLGDFGRAAAKTLLAATLVFHGFHCVLIGFLQDFYMITMDFHGFWWFRGARRPKRFWPPRWFFIVFIAFWWNFYMISVISMDFGDFGARGGQNAFGRHARFSWFSWRFDTISIWFPSISMDLVDFGARDGQNAFGRHAGFS